MCSSQNDQPIGTGTVWRGHGRGRARGYGVRFPHDHHSRQVLDLAVLAIPLWLRNRRRARLGQDRGPHGLQRGRSSVPRRGNRRYTQVRETVFASRMGVEVMCAARVGVLVCMLGVVV
jgi:hypothetical protein